MSSNEMDEVNRDEFSLFIRENLIKLDLDDRPITTDVYKNNLAVMQYVNSKGILIAQAIYRKGIKRYEIRKEYRNV